MLLGAGRRGRAAELGTGFGTDLSVLPEGCWFEFESNPGSSVHRTRLAGSPLTRLAGSPLTRLARHERFTSSSPVGLRARRTWHLRGRFRGLRILHGEEIQAPAAVALRGGGLPPLPRRAQHRSAHRPPGAPAPALRDSGHG